MIPSSHFLLFPPRFGSGGGAILTIFPMASTSTRFIDLRGLLWRHWSKNASYIRRGMLIVMRASVSSSSAFIRSTLSRNQIVDNSCVYRNNEVQSMADLCKGAV